MRIKREDVRNIAIIAHVDHGKTTLVDCLLRQSGVFRANQEVVERVMDSNEIERERGITILSKNTAVEYKGTKINIVDTPGHADFGGEVERVLKMVNGVILVVDAYEGPMPQTKFVLRKALELDLPVIVCLNKIDRPEARPEEVVDEVLELFMDLDASDEQLDCPFLYASAKGGFAKKDLDDPDVDMTPLFETIIDYIPAPEGDPDADTQVLISTIDYNEYVGRIGIGKVDNGSLKVNQDCVLVNHHDPDKFKKIKIGKLYEFDGLNRWMWRRPRSAPSWPSPVSRTSTSAIPSALRKIRRPFRSRRSPSPPFPWTSWSMTALWPARRENMSPPAICATGCSGS